MVTFWCFDDSPELLYMAVVSVCYTVQSVFKPVDHLIRNTEIKMENILPESDVLLRIEPNIHFF